MDNLQTEGVTGAHGGLRSVSLLTELKASLVEEADNLNLDLMKFMVDDLGKALNMKEQNDIKDTSLIKDEIKKGARSKDVSSSKYNLKEQNKNRSEVRYNLKIKDCSTDEGSSAFENENSSYSESESETNKKKRKNRLRNKRRARKYTVDGSSCPDEDTDIDQFGKGGQVWLKRLVELEKTGMEPNKALNRIFIILAGEMLEVLRNFSRANIKAVKPLKYGIEKVQTFEAFLEDFERYAREQLGKDKNRWAVELRNFLEGPILRTYYSIYRSKLSYGTVVTRLRNWCKEEKDSEILDLQREFWKSERRANEKFSDFALRLQTTYEAATPTEQRDVDVLKKQFLNCLPKKTARRFKLRMGSEKDSTKVRWKDVISWARDEDDVEEQDEMEPRDNALPVWATLNEEGRMRQNAYDERRHYARERSNVNRNYEPRQYSRQENRMSDPRNMRCLYCKKLGHAKRNCWKLNRWCLACGSDEHKVVDCDVRGEFYNRNYYNRQGGSNIQQKKSGNIAEQKQGSSNIDQRQGNSNVEQRQFRNVQRVENKCYICHENDHLTESCSRFNEFEAWRKGMPISASGNEFAPPMPGMGRSLEQ